MAKEEAVTFTPREMEVLALAWQCFESEPKVNNHHSTRSRLAHPSTNHVLPQIDIKKLARLTGYTEGSAGVTIGKIKRKLKTHAANNDDGDDGTTPASTPKKTPAKTPKSTGKRAASTAATQDTPAKKRKAPQGSAPEPAVLQEEEEEEEEFKLKTEVVDDDEEGGYDGFYRH